MSTKIKWALFFLILVAGISVWFLTDDKKSEKSSNPYHFAVKDTSAITRIFMTDRSGTRINLIRQPSHWVLNNTYPARQNAIDNLMDAIRRVELKFIPPGVALDHITKDLATHGIKVVIYGKGDHILKGYYVGGVTPDERGTYMIMEGSEKPAVTYIPGWEGGLRARYWMHPVDWRDRTVLGFSFDEIKEVTVQYPEQAGESFHLGKTGKGIEVRPLFRSAKSQDQGEVPGAGEAYLMGFRNLGAEAIVENQNLIDSLRGMKPFAMISVLTENSEVRTIEIFPYEEAGSGYQRPSERYYALSNWGDLYLIQDRIFRRILRGYSYFTLPGTTDN